jgi:hypothetical protein
VRSVIPTLGFRFESVLQSQVSHRPSVRYMPTPCAKITTLTYSDGPRRWNQIIHGVVHVTKVPEIRIAVRRSAAFEGRIETEVRTCLIEFAF